MIKTYKRILILGILFLGLSAASVFAATVSIVPDKTSFSVGDEFNVVLALDTKDVNINAAQGIVHFSPSVLSLISVDKSKSIFNFWVEDPTISNTAGAMSFIGGNPQSSSGVSLNIITMKFKAAGAGSSTISFTDGVVTADDGLGTNVLSATVNSSVSVSGTASAASAPATPTAQPATPAPVIRTAAPAKNLPVLPTVTVNLYPDETSWYNQSGDVIAFWDVPADITGVAVSVDNNPKTIPTKFDAVLANGKDLGVLKEGIWYVHARFKNNMGSGPVLHRKIMIDLTPPLPFSVTVKEGLKTDNPTPALDFGTQDSLSGIDHYEVAVGNQAPIISNGGELKLPILGPGDYSITVKAFDKAGNSAESPVDLTILPLPSPEIKFFTQPFYSDSDNTLLVSGTSLPDGMVLLSVVDNSGLAAARGTARADDKGQWDFSFSDAFKNGDYKITARTQDERGALSYPVEDSFRVQSRPIFKLGFIQLTLTGVIIMLLIILIGGFAGGVWFYKMKQKRAGRRIFVTQRDIANISDAAKSDIVKLKKACKEPGTVDEESIVKHLENTIFKLDTYIEEEVEKIVK